MAEDNHKKLYKKENKTQDEKDHLTHLKIQKRALSKCLQNIEYAKNIPKYTVGKGIYPRRLINRL